MSNVKINKMIKILFGILIIYSVALVIVLLCNLNYILAEENAVPSLIEVKSISDENVSKLHDCSPTPIEYEDGTSELPNDPSYDDYFPNLFKADVLINEQFLFDKYVPETTPKKHSKNKNSWQMINDAYGPISAIVDLGAYYTITNTFIYDVNGAVMLNFEYGEPFAFHDYFNVELNLYNNWNRIDKKTPQSTRYIRISGNYSTSGAAEMGFYGVLDKSKPVVGSKLKSPGNYNKATVDKSIGVNAFIDDPIQVSSVAGTIREFHNLSFSYKDGASYFSPANTSGWDFDEYYKELYENNIDTIACIQGTTKYISGDIPGFTGNEKPIAIGANAEDPMSYKEHSSIMFNYAARYGKTHVDSSRLTLGENQIPTSGLGYITYYENFNEPNKDWEHMQSYFSAYEFAAMCSADFDGHESRLGSDYGVRNADPNAKLVMGGLVDKSMFEYIKLMAYWFENNRDDGVFAVDVINLHVYDDQFDPENTIYQELLKEITDWVNINIPGVEVIVSEFTPSVEGINEADKFEPMFLENQANALVRTYLLGLESGINRSIMFMLRDTDGGVYSHYGLVTKKGEWRIKSAWHYVSTMKNTLEDMYFDKVIEKGDTYVFRFVSKKDKNKISYAVWRPEKLTASNPMYKSIPYTLYIGDMKSACMTTMEYGLEYGSSSNLAISDGKVTVNTSGRVVFITTHKTEQVSIKSDQTKLDIKNIIGREHIVENTRKMFDEQNFVPTTPSTNLAKTADGSVIFKTSPPGLYGNDELFPTSVIVDLGNYYDIRQIGFYDGASDGLFKIHAQTASGGYVEILSSNLKDYNFWNIVDVHVRTRYLKIERFNNAQIKEIGIYGQKLS